MLRTILLTATGAVTVAALGAYALTGGGATDLAPAPLLDPTVPAVATPPTTASEDPTATPTPLPAPTPTATPTPTPAATDGDVARVQQALTDLRYYVGEVDGRAGPATAAAVQAFQKVNGLSADGVIGPATLAAIEDPVVPSLRGGGGDRIEVDLDRQVLYLVRGGAIDRILPISSGSGETYTNPGGGSARSVTPVGTFTVERHIRGERHAPLGTLYDPMYFHRGWAIHGSSSVPAHPASHGCVRVTRADATWLFDRVPIGMTVQIYGSLNSFDPSAGQTAGTDAPAGDTPETTPDDGLQTEAPSPSPAPGPSPTQPTPSQPAPTQPAPTQPAPTQPAPADPPPTQPTATPPAQPTPDAAAPAGPAPATPAAPAADRASGET